MPESPMGLLHNWSAFRSQALGPTETVTDSLSVSGVVSSSCTASWPPFTPRVVHLVRTSSCLTHQSHARRGSPSSTDKLSPFIPDYRLIGGSRVRLTSILATVNGQHGLAIGQARVRPRVTRVGLYRLLEMAQGLSYTVYRSLVPAVPALQIELIR